MRRTRTTNVIGARARRKAAHIPAERMAGILKTSKNSLYIIEREGLATLKQAEIMAYVIGCLVPELAYQPRDIREYIDLRYVKKAAVQLVREVGLTVETQQLIDAITVLEESLNQ